MLSDAVERGLSTVGVTQERVERWLGRPCGCKERKDRMDQLELWAKGAFRRGVERARSYLEDVLS